MYKNSLCSSKEHGHTSKESYSVTKLEQHRCETRRAWSSFQRCRCWSNPPEDLDLFGTVCCVVLWALPVVPKGSWLRAQGHPLQIPREDIVQHCEHKGCVVTISKAFARSEARLCRMFSKHPKIKVKFVDHPNERQIQSNKDTIHSLRGLRDWIVSNRKIKNYMGRPLVHPSSRDAV